jgi:hypothetical protein
MVPLQQSQIKIDRFIHNPVSSIDPTAFYDEDENKHAKH